MSTYDYEAIRRETRNFHQRQIVALSAACAEKVAPMVHYLATPSTWALARASLDFVWRSVLRDDFDSGQAATLKEKLESTPEWQCEELDTIQATVVSVLNFFVWALESVITYSPPPEGERGESVGFSHMLTTAEEFDVAIARFRSLAEPTSEMAEAEQNSQERLVAMVRGQLKLSEMLVTSMKDEATTISRLFEEKLPVLCFEHISDFVK